MTRDETVRSPHNECQMNGDHDRNLEEVIDALLENVFWAWNYFFALEGLHEEYKISPESFARVPDLTTCLLYALFDALFAKSSQFIDKTRNVQSVYHLFKLVRRYRPQHTEMLRHVKEHTRALDVPANTIARRIINWRNNVVAHRALDGLNDVFFEENRISLSEFKAFLEQIDGVVQFYSKVILNRANDTTSGALRQKHDVHNLFRYSPQPRRR